VGDTLIPKRIPPRIDAVLRSGETPGA